MRKLFLVLAVLVLSVTAAFAWPTWTGTSTLTIASDNTHSAALSLPRGLKVLSVNIPTVDSGTVEVEVSNDGTTFVDFYYMAGAAAAPAKWITGSGTHAYATQLPEGVTAWKYIRFVTSADQTANRTFTVYGRD